MPTIRVSNALLIEALNLAEQYGSSHLAFKSGATDLPEATLRNRINRALLNGLKPTYIKVYADTRQLSQMAPSHLVIPDTQVKSWVNTDHIEWAANYVVAHKPTVLVVIGDWYDMESLSSYDKGRRSFEGRRYVKDIKAGRDAMERFWKVIDDYNRTALVKYTPRRVFVLGNHEMRIVRATDIQPELHDKLSLDDLGLSDYGFEVPSYLEPIDIHGVLYSHFFTSGSLGRAVSSPAKMLQDQQQSCTQGHNQNTAIAMHHKTKQTGMFCGCFYTHNEEYMSPQDNAGHRRHIVHKTEVVDGVYDFALRSVGYLKKAYS